MHNGGKKGSTFLLVLRCLNHTSSSRKALHGVQEGQAHSKKHKLSKKYFCGRSIPGSPPPARLKKKMTRPPDPSFDPQETPNTQLISCSLISIFYTTGLALSLLLIPGSRNMNKKPAVVVSIFFLSGWTTKLHQPLSEGRGMLPSFMEPFPG